MKKLSFIPKLVRIVSDKDAGCSILTFSDKEELRVQGLTAATQYSHLLGLPRSRVYGIVQSQLL
jgi:hypothetical protein